MLHWYPTHGTAVNKTRCAQNIQTCDAAVLLRTSSLCPVSVRSCEDCSWRKYTNYSSSCEVCNHNGTYPNREEGVLRDLSGLAQQCSTEREKNKAKALELTRKYGFSHVKLHRSCNVIHHSHTARRFIHILSQTTLWTPRNYVFDVTSAGQRSSPWPCKSVKVEIIFFSSANYNPGFNGNRTHELHDTFATYMGSIPVEARILFFRFLQWQLL